MRIALTIIVLFLCFCNGSAFADNVSTNAVVQENHGYVYGDAPKADNAATTAADVNTTGSNPVAGIINAVERLDAWIQKNLW